MNLWQTKRIQNTGSRQQVPVCQDLRGSQIGRAQTSGAEWISQNIHYLQPEIGSELSVENRAVLDTTLAGYPGIMLG